MSLSTEEEQHTLIANLLAGNEELRREFNSIKAKINEHIKNYLWQTKV
jgi:hypothetical protein